MRGHGQSQLDRVGYSRVKSLKGTMEIETLAIDVINDLCENHRDKVAKEGITIVGHSLGAKVAMNIALRMHGKEHLPGQWFRNWSKGVQGERIGEATVELLQAPEHDDFKFRVNSVVCLESTPLPTVPHPIDNPVSATLQKVRDVALDSLRLEGLQQIEQYVKENLDASQAYNLLAHLEANKENNGFYYNLPLEEMTNVEDFYNLQSVCSDHSVHDYRGRVIAI